MAKVNDNTRIILLAALAAMALALALYIGATAHADGGYLHLSEANALAKKVAGKTNGVVVLMPCVRTSSRTASCGMRQIEKPQGIVCDYLIRVSKRYSHHHYAWSAKAGAGDCRYVG